MSGFTWVKHAETGGVWNCPDAALDDMTELGWQKCDPPEPVDPAMAEHRAQAAARAQTAAAAAKETKPTKAASGGKSEKE